MDYSSILQQVSCFWDSQAQPALERFVSRKSLSPGFDAKWRENGVLLQVCREAAAFGEKHFHEANFSVLQDEGRSPSLFFSIEPTGRFRENSENTVFFYGHLDKQPEASGWSAGLSAWQAVVRDGRLYGRGCADDGYSFYGAMTAIRALECEGIPHPRCVGFFETREETGSNDVDYYLAKLRTRCGSPRIVFVLDSGAGSYRQLWLTNSVRGTLSANLTVKILRHAVHSGEAGGIVPGTFDALRILLDRLTDPLTGHFRLSCFNPPIPERRLEEIKSAAKFLGEDYLTRFPWCPGLNGAPTRPYEDLVEKAVTAQTWKPSLSIIGAGGLPAPSEAANVQLPQTTLRLSIRIPPAADPEESLRQMTKELTRDPPFNVAVSFSDSEALSGWQAPEEAPWFSRACDQASLALWGLPALRKGEGGSIPILNLFAGLFPRAQFAVTGVLGPGSNAHGPDESLDIGYTRKFLACISSILANVPE
ncbi:M20/M25/M40 family metallo-hydrolase [Mesosutterella sp. OilRF-GAM-744-9]|uniref:M20/M25/M40 family metallo-hydrolase n=1 Tax=Mesosutterella porci TaxID=2915351 RepID=A0ABS9MRE4_9BURK|nr:M20/M25/M40 family metallo-hydrolase [Mesosutterella sp. oilRF-744-WT-GAM-9]MCG5031194.1 M20/M25/M40 family metallo-hydrolase [Mesosutterella sp. oilRF-744-WT-GAM-9]